MHPQPIHLVTKQSPFFGSSVPQNASGVGCDSPLFTAPDHLVCTSPVIHDLSCSRSLYVGTTFTPRAGSHLSSDGLSSCTTVAESQSNTIALPISHSFRPFRRSRKIPIVHPYNDIFTRDSSKKKRRRVWDHVFETSIFTSDEILTINVPDRRRTYIASLEAHIDLLHRQFELLGYWPCSLDDLEQFRGMNSVVAKSMIAGLQQDGSMFNLKLSELQRTNTGLQRGIFDSYKDI